MSFIKVEENMRTEELVVPEISKKELNNGNIVPMVGLGTDMIQVSTVRDMVFTCILKGDTMIDVAPSYFKEIEVGKAIAVCRICSNIYSREKIFIISSINKVFLTPNLMMGAIEDSVHRMHLDHTNLFILRYFEGIDYISLWKVLETNFYRGLMKGIGVENFTLPHLQNLIKNSVIPPLCNKVDEFPFLSDRKLLNFCLNHKIAVISNGYSGSQTFYGDKYMTTTTDIDYLCDKYTKNSREVVVRYLLDRGFIVMLDFISTVPWPYLNVHDFKLRAEEVSHLMAIQCYPPMI